ncbi:GDSL-type esterase/lipase family protein [Pseudarthrobacter sp. B907]|uniref:SGNH/GDSL hydrolase family protein n=1 Tax=Pseudarthrobacter sp. B907 TaxID=3158261 RepID=UPI0032DAD770
MALHMTSGGLLAVGDSIVDGHGDSMAGVPAMSWAQWLADAMDLSYTRYARGGIRSAEIVTDLLPRVRGKYAVGVFNMGTNDALKNWDAKVFRASMETAAEVMTSACERVVVLNVPTSAEATAIIEDIAAARGITVVDAALAGGRFLAADGVHPTALGHLRIADRAAAAIGAPAPSTLALNQGKNGLGAPYWLGYGWRSAQAQARRTAKAILRR